MGSISMGDRKEGKRRIRKRRKIPGWEKDPDSLSVSVKTKRRGATLSLVKIYGSFHTYYNGFRSMRLYRSWNPGGHNERNMFTIIIWSHSLPSAFQHTRMFVAWNRRTNANPKNVVRRRFKTCEIFP